MNRGDQSILQCLASVHSFTQEEELRRAEVARASRHEYAIMARRERGLPRFEALIDACHKRARPIVMTTFAMGAGMLPTALGFGADPSFRQPMAVVVIGGLVTSTLLSLLVIPVIFTYVDDFERKLRGVAHRFAGPSPRPSPPAVSTQGA
ncbi:efflux RND transporter permease subunit [Sphingomonas aracearum]|uniref:efflux RND transporter permease subunit n=1 Tax=Sphingomonas aracearum TaxID=2283317 RepID=UPI001EF1261E|nr:efflux RND transporter permease subunit [Sphingomonas aracearum]